MSAALAYDESFMSVPCLYRTQKDLLDRLEGVVLKYDGVPYYTTIMPPNMLNLYDLTDRKVTSPKLTVNADDPKLDISIPECRYVNFKYDEKEVARGYPSGKIVVYVTRDPNKMWKQGFCLSYSKFHAIDGPNKNGLFDAAYIGRSKGMYDSLMNDFPTVESVLSEFKDVPAGQAYDVAVSKDVAFRRSEVGVVFVYYRTDMVGWMAPGTTKINVVESDLGWVVERHLKRLSLA